MNESEEQKRPAGSPQSDPYTAFLDLPPGPRPPHLYQVLDIEVFCPHPEQITHAVRKQFRKVKVYEDYPDRETREKVQNIINHIATANTVLTDPNQREVYDEKLAAHLKLDREAILNSRLAARAPEYRLQVLAGPAQVGMHLDLMTDRVITIGSDPHNVATLTGSRTQPMHAQLKYLDNEWIIRTHQGKPTIIVNDQRCTEFLLADGDLIDIGSYRLLFSRIDLKKKPSSSVPPPISLIVRQGPSIPDPVMHAVAPASVLIGSCETALWQLAGRRQSKHHCRVEADGVFWQVRDLHSDSGTFVNDEKVRQSILNHRDQITVGECCIQVSLRK